MALDVPPCCRVGLDNPARELWVTEGVKKGDALATAGVVAIALLGVWNWRGTNDKAGKTALPDWEAIAVNERVVYLAFDSDVVEKPAVYSALARLSAFLRSRGATVRVVYLPSALGGAKVGVDDHLAAGGTIDGLRELAEDELRARPEPERAAPKPTSELLRYVANLITRHVHLPGDHELTALCLYVLHTWAISSARVTPYVYVVSPAKRSGKTRLLETLELAVHEPLRAASVTPAALYQSIDRWKPTLMIDEVDAVFSGSRASERTEELRGVLNAGNARGSFVVRGTQEGEPAKFSVFCCKLVAGIDNGRLPDTIRDRSIVVALERAAREEVARLRPADLASDVGRLRAMLGDWSHAHRDRLAEMRSEPIPEISDRLDEAWEPLCAIAELAGGDWPERARAAAVALAGRTEDDSQDLGTALLAALRTMFGEDVHAFASKVACERLNADAEAPFGGMRGGQGINQRALSRLLRPYGIKSRTVRTDDGTSRGYHRDQLAGPWQRYLPATRARTADPPAQPEQTTQATHPNAHGDSDVSDVSDVSDDVPGAARACASSNSRPPGRPADVAGRDAERGSPERAEYLRRCRERHEADLAAGAPTLADPGEAEWLAAFPETAFEVERDVKGSEAAALLGIHHATLDAMRRRGELAPSTDAGAGAGKRWYPMRELRRIKPNVAPPPDVGALTKRESDLAERYRKAWPWLVRGEAR